MDTQFVQAGPLRVRYLEAGTGRPLVMLHAGSMSADVANIAEGYDGRLADQYRVLAPDTRGHGSTVNPGDEITYARLARDVIAFCSALGLEQPILWGFSDGANTALEVAMQAPELAQAIVLHAAVTTFSDRYLGFMRGFLHASPDGAPDLDAIAAEQAGFVGYWRQLHAAQGPDHWRELLPQLASMWLTPLSYSAADFARVSAPALVINGDRDESMSPEEQVWQFRQLPNAELALLPGLTHYVLRSTDTDVVLDFLARRAVAEQARIRA